MQRTSLASGSSRPALGKEFQLNHLQIYCTNALLLLVKILLCGKLQYQKVLKLKPISYKITSLAGESSSPAPPAHQVTRLQPT